MRCCALTKEKMISASEAAQLAAEYGLADLDADWWTDQVDQGSLAAVVIKRRRRFFRDDVEAFLNGKVLQLHALKAAQRLGMTRRRRRANAAKKL